MDKQKQEKIMEKARLKVAIANLKEDDVNFKSSQKSLLKMVATFVLAIGITGGLVYATGTAVYEKIWKDPESYKLTQEITEEEKAKCISQEEAEKIGNDYLKKIGLDEETIKNLNLEKNLLENENIWYLNSEKVTITIDAETGKIKSVSIPTWEYTIPKNFGITREEARKTAWQLLEKYRPEDDTGDYKMVSLVRNMETDEASYIWYATFQKQYGDLINEEEEIKIGWVPTINGLYCLSFKSNPYENNEEKITKEEAIQIAVQKDKEIETNKTITGTKAEIRIRQMNAQVYLRENDKEQYEKGILSYMEKTGENTYKLKEDAVFYQTEERVRKVWCVVVEYDDKTSYTYFVDCTTGEIIGGAMFDNLIQEELIYNDQYNLIEKE